MPFTGFLHLAHVSYLSQRLHVEGTCLREHLANLLTSRLQQNDMNSVNLQYIKLNNAKTYEQTPAILKNKYTQQSKLILQKLSKHYRSELSDEYFAIITT